MNSAVASNCPSSVVCSTPTSCVATPPVPNIWKTPQPYGGPADTYQLFRAQFAGEVDKVTVNTIDLRDCIKRHDDLKIFLSSALENEAKAQAAASAKQELDIQAKGAVIKFFGNFTCGKRSYWNDDNKKTATLEDVINHALGKNKGFFFSNTGADTKKALINYGVDFKVLEDKSKTMEEKIRHVSEKINSPAPAPTADRKPS